MLTLIQNHNCLIILLYVKTEKRVFLSLNIMSHDDSILFIILCVSYVIFSPFIWNDSYLKLCSTGITNLGLNSDMIFKSYLHPIFI